MVSEKKVEKIIFFIVSLLNVIPVLSGKYFPTMDGPSHLYNANLINQIWFHSSFISRYFIINPIPVPNWLGHFCLAFLHLFLPAYFAEKLLILAYFFGMPYSFRWLIKSIEPGATWTTYVIFPFTYCLLLTLGFYNFCLSFILLFLTWGNWERNRNNLNFKNWIVLFFLCTLIYFSHLFTYFVLGLSLVIFSIWEIGIHFFNNSGSNLFREIKRKIIFLASIFSLSTVLLIWYFLEIHVPPQFNIINFSKAELWQRLFEVRAVICWSYAHESPFSQGIGISLCILIVIILILNVLTIINKNDLWSKKIILKKSSWFLLSLIILIFLFMIPNSFNAGLISDRIEIIFFLILIVWIAIQKIPNKLIAMPLAAMLVLHFVLVIYYVHVIRYQNIEIKEFEQISADIKPNKVVLPICYSDNWIDGHYSCFMGVDKPLIILGDYEAELNWFPVIWNKQSIPNFYFGSHSQNGFCYWWYHNENNPPQKIDYVVLWQRENNACLPSIDSTLNKDYLLEKTYPDAQLYKLK
jgi:hypothetical protein